MDSHTHAWTNVAMSHMEQLALSSDESKSAHRSVGATRLGVRHWSSWRGKRCGKSSSRASTARRGRPSAACRRCLPYVRPRWRRCLQRRGRRSMLKTIETLKSVIMCDERLIAALSYTKRVAQERTIVFRPTRAGTRRCRHRICASVRAHSAAILSSSGAKEPSSDGAEPKLETRVLHELLGELVSTLPWCRLWRTNIESWLST